ncbi:MAG TPA: serine/threonine protein kinase [Thermoanaerobaculia bacterium]|jgi:Ser/Thr protein kinase RdoA (MazF antagonist)|nr:serine/threonine protein kinase [Thermoanaerobaculia bacterium]
MLTFVRDEEREPLHEDPTGLFLALTPDRVLAAVEAAGLTTTGLCYPLNSFENRVYEVELTDRSRLVAKFYRPGRWSGEQIGEEHALLRELAEAEVPVPPLRAFADGSTRRRIDGIWYALWDRSGGRAPDELDDALAERLGMLVGRLHEVSARQPLLHRPRLDSARYVHLQLAWLRRHRTLPEAFERRYVEAAEGIAAAHDALAAGVDYQRIHADLHLGNVLLRDGQLRLLDFDDMASGPPVQDVWLALPGRDPDSLRRRDAFLAGYERFRAFDAATLRLVEPLRGLRLVRYAGWLARRWHDPAFRAGWPHFGTPEYWRDETETLEAQLRLIHGERPEAAANAPAAAPARDELLSNKDYFFDWEGD